MGTNSFEAADGFAVGAAPVEAQLTQRTRLKLTPQCEKPRPCCQDSDWETELAMIILPTGSGFQIHLITANPKGVSILLPNINLNILSIGKNRTAIRWKLEIF